MCEIYKHQRRATKTERVTRCWGREVYPFQNDTEIIHGERIAVVGRVRLPYFRPSAGAFRKREGNRTSCDFCQTRPLFAPLAPDLLNSGSSIEQNANGFLFPLPYPTCAFSAPSTPCPTNIWGSTTPRVVIFFPALVLAAVLLKKKYKEREKKGDYPTCVLPTYSFSPALCVVRSLQPYVLHGTKRIYVQGWGFTYRDQLFSHLPLLFSLSLAYLLSLSLSTMRGAFATYRLRYPDRVLCFFFCQGLFIDFYSFESSGRVRRAARPGDVTRHIGECVQRSPSSPSGDCVENFPAAVFPNKFDTVSKITRCICTKGRTKVYEGLKPGFEKQF